jgi:CP family cyanate transporter-like MFS transporter
MTITASATSHRLLRALLLLWLCGVALRLTILAVPPVIPLIHDDLNLSATEVGILTGLPSLLFALAAVPGSLVIARLGVQAALITGLVVTAVAGALRGAIHDIYWLDAMTIAMGAGVAVMQVTLPPAVRNWAPQRIPFATAVYTNGLLIGEILPVALTIPLVLPLLGQSWQWGFVVWSAPVVAIAALVLLFAPRQAVNGTASAAARPRWWPDWNNSLIWRLGVMLGTVNAMYFGTNAFLPDYLKSIGQPEWTSWALTALNLGQLPASALLLAFASRLQLKMWPIVMTGVLTFAATLGIVFSSGIWIVVAAAFMGFSAAAILILVLALPPLLSAPDDVHRVSAAMFTISYTCAVVVPVVSGLCWDLSGVPAAAFVPVGFCALVLASLAPSIAHVKPYRS